MKEHARVWWSWLAVCLLFPSGAHAELYKWVDDQGNVTYSQIPPADQRNVQTIHSQKAPTVAPAPPGQAQNRFTNKPANSKAPDGARAQGESQDLDALRQKNCDAAKKNLEIYTMFRRVQNEKGEVTVLDDNVRAAKIKEAQSDVQLYCHD